MNSPDCSFFWRQTNNGLDIYIWSSTISGRNIIIFYFFHYWYFGSTSKHRINLYGLCKNLMKTTTSSQHFHGYSSVHEFEFALCVPSHHQSAFSLFWSTLRMKSETCAGGRSECSFEILPIQRFCVMLKGFIGKLCAVKLNKAVPKNINCW